MLVDHSPPRAASEGRDRALVVRSAFLVLAVAMLLLVAYAAAVSSDPLPPAQAPLASSSAR